MSQKYEPSSESLDVSATHQGTTRGGLFWTWSRPRLGTRWMPVTLLDPWVCACAWLSIAPARGYVGIPVTALDPWVRARTCVLAGCRVQGSGYSACKDAPECTLWLLRERMPVPGHIRVRQGGAHRTVNTYMYMSYGHTHTYRHVNVFINWFEESTSPQNLHLMRDMPFLPPPVRCRANALRAKRF